MGKCARRMYDIKKEPIESNKGEAYMETELNKIVEAESKKDKKAEADAEALLARIDRNVAKQTVYARLQFICALVCVVILIVALLALGMKLFPLIDQVSGTLTQVSETLTHVNGTITEFNQTVEDMRLADVARSVTTLAEAGSAGIAEALVQLEEAMQGVGDALQVIEKLNISGLNAGISKLNTVLEPLAKFFGR